MLLLDLVGDSCPAAYGCEPCSRLSMLPRELNWSDARRRFVRSQLEERSVEDELEDKTNRQVVKIQKQSVNTASNQKKDLCDRTLDVNTVEPWGLGAPTAPD